MADKSIGQIAGTIVGGIIGAFIPGGYVALGAAIGGAIGGAIDPPKGPNIVGPRLSDLSAQTAAYGTVIPRVYGSGAIYGNVFWIENNAIKETERTESQGGKGGGGGQVTTYSYSATFAVGLCEGPITNIRRIWAGSKLIYFKDSDDFGTILASSEIDDQVFDIYYGTADQLPDDRMQAALGVADTPAWRGLCYIVFKDFQLADYGNSLLGCPIKVEVVNQPLTWAPMVLSIAPNVKGWFLRGTYFDGEIVKTLYRNGYYSDEYFVEETDRYGRYLGGYAFSSSAPTPYFLNVGPPGQTDVPCFSLLRQSGGNDVYWVSYDGVTLFEHTLTHGFGGRSPVGIKATGDGRFIHYIATYHKLYVWGPEATDYYVVDTSSIISDIYDVAFNATHFYLAEQRSDSFLPKVVVVEIATGTIAATLTCPQLSSGAPQIFCAPDGVAYMIDGQSYLENAISVFRVADGTITLHAPFVFTYGVIEYHYGRFWTDGTLFYQANRRDSYVNSGVNGLALDMAYARVEPGGVTLRSIVEAECLKSGLLTLDDIDASELTDLVRFYRVASVGAIRGALEPLVAAYPFDVVPAGYGIKFPRRGKSSLLTVPYDDLGASEPGAAPPIRITEAREMDSQLPQRVTVSYLDVNREYDTGEQFAERLSTESVNVQMLELAIGFTADEAAGTAEVLLYLAWLERYDLSFVLPPKADYLKLQPADVITLTGDGYTREVRLTTINLLPDGRLECTAKFNFAATYTPAAQGEEGQSTGGGTVSHASPTEAEYLDVPCLQSTLMDRPGFLVAAGGAIDSWPGAVLYRSTDAGQTWLAAQALPTPGSVVGLATDVLANGRTDLIDTANTLTFRRMTAGTLASVTDAALANGANHFAIGAHGRWEIVGARTVVDVGNGVYTLSNLMRGRFGSEQYGATHAAGDTVVLLDQAMLRFIDMNTADFGLVRDWKAATVGGIFDATPSESFTYTGVNLECLSPIRLNGHRDIGSFDWTLLWTRRSRTPVEPFSGLPTPLGETSEAYEVEIWDATYTTLKRTLTASGAATVVYTFAQQTADFGEEQITLYVRVYQMSSVVGRGYPLQTSITRSLSGDPLIDSVWFASHFDGSNGSTTFVDLKGATLTANGGAQISTTQSKGGGASFWANAGYASVSPANALDLSQGAASVLELYWYPTSTGAAGTLVQTFTNTGSANGYTLYTNTSNQVGLYVREYYVCTAAAASQCTLNAWNHVALVVDGSTCKIYINGVFALSGSVANKAQALSTSDRSWIGGDIYGARINGYIDEIRLTRALRYTENFTPPAAPFPNP